MESLKRLIDGARSGDLGAFGRIVQRFQHMAYGYAYSLLADFHLAEDVAQEAFLDAHRHLSALRAPAAFPGWFRRIVFKHCDRLLRGKRLSTVPLDSVADNASPAQGPDQAMERQELRDSVLDAVRALPQAERTATALFYIGGHSQDEIAEFLGIPVTTVNNRLHASRERLKERMVTMVRKKLGASALPKGFCSIVLDRLTGGQLKSMKGSPVNKYADLLITTALRDGCERLKISLDGSGVVSIQGFEAGEWKEWSAPPARVIPDLLALVVAAAEGDGAAGRLQADLPFTCNGKKSAARLEVANITLSIAMPRRK